MTSHNRNGSLAFRRKGFTLIEVVVALAISLFAAFAMVGLLAVGIQSNRDSKEQLQAATIMEAVCVTRRASPTNDFSVSQPLFPLPRLNAALGASANNLTTPIYLSWDGNVTTANKASFGFLYNIVAPASYATAAPANATVYMCVFWPPQGSLTSTATGRYELTTTFALP